MKTRGSHSRWFLATAIFLLTRINSIGSGHAMSGLDEFSFLNPGVTITKNGPGLEFSAGRNHFKSWPGLAGIVSQVEFIKKRANLGVEVGLAIFQMEFSYSISEMGNSVLWVPNLSIPIPHDASHGAVFNFFYRDYLQTSGQNTFGGSIKIAFLKD